MTSDDLIQLHRQYLMPNYAPGLVIVRGQGSWVWDAAGREYLDFMSGIAVLNLGHCHPRVVDALCRQATRLWHMSNFYYNEHQPLLAQALSQRSLGGKCYFCNSGAEANESLIKLARLWGHEQGGRYEVITMRNSFHGRTLATLTATGQDKVKRGFAPLPEGFAYADFNDLESVRAAITDRTAAVLIEPVQGEGGIVPADAEFMTGLRALCDEAGILFLSDEIQAGIGRTGQWFGYQGYGIEVDAFSTAKALGNGYPIGAIVANPALADVLGPGTHATTFGGSPLAAAVSRAVIETIEREGLLERATDAGRRLLTGMEELAEEFDYIEHARGRGLMLGMVLNRPAAPYVERLRNHGMLALATAGNVVRLLPPLNVTSDEVQRASQLLRTVAEEEAAAEPAGT